MICEACKGTGVEKIFSWKVRGEMVLPCLVCDGAKMVSQEKLDRMTEGARVRNKREELGIGLRDFARLCGHSPSHVADIELGRADDEKTLKLMQFRIWECEKDKELAAG